MCLLCVLLLLPLMSSSSLLLLLLLRWNEKFDFIMIPANSVLLATVWDQTSVVEAVTSLRISRVSVMLPQQSQCATLGWGL